MTERDEDDLFRREMEALRVRPVGAGRPPIERRPRPRERGVPHDYGTKPPARRPLEVPRPAKGWDATVEARLDLHQATVDEAIELVASFVHLSRRRGLRQVLVVTGRGRGSAGSRPVLRPMVVEWTRAAGRRHVERCWSAPPRLGGDGALVLVLRSLDDSPR